MDFNAPVFPKAGPGGVFSFFHIRRKGISAAVDAGFIPAVFYALIGTGK